MSEATERMWKEWCAQKKAVNPKWVEPPSNYMLRQYFRSGQRIEVTSPNGFVRRGTVSVTTGVQPRLMLVHRANAFDSWDLLDEDDLVTAVIWKHGVRGEINDPDILFQAACYRGVGDG